MKEKKFEQAIKELESIVGDMEAGELSLDESLQKYEEGIKLAHFCKSKLESAEKKIEILQKKADGSIAIEDFDKDDAAVETAEKIPAEQEKIEAKVSDDDSGKSDVSAETNAEDIKVNAVPLKKATLEEVAEKYYDSYDDADDEDDTDAENQPASPTLRDSNTNEDEELLF